MHRHSPSHERIRKLAAVVLFAAAFLFGECGAMSSDAKAEETGLMAPAPTLISAPPITLQKLDGSAFSLTARRGNFTLINFWALWCAPCKKEMPDLARLKTRMAGRGMDVVAVNLGDKKAPVIRFLKQVGADGLTVLLDDEGKTGRDWHVQGLPVTFLVDPFGWISHAALGAREWAGDDAVRWIEERLSTREN